MENFLEFKNVCKNFGSFNAISNLSFAIPKNSIAGFVGPNGAGKTTSFSLIASLLNLDKGEILIDNKTHKDFLKCEPIGILPQNAGFHEDVTVKEELKFLSSLLCLPRKKRKEEIEELIEAVGLQKELNKKIHKLSFGMKIKLKVAQAFLGSPRLVLLDEPTAGLDPEAVIKIRELILKYKNKSTVIISSHNLLELQSFCDYICMINNGALRFQGMMDDILTSKNGFSLKIDKKDFDFIELKNKFPDLKIEKKEDYLSFLITLSNFDKIQIQKEVMKYLLNKDIAILEILSKEGLEEKFFENLYSKN